MAVSSYLEIFLTIFGWHFYGVIWDVMSATGIVYLPFFGILIETWKDAYVDEWGAGAGWAVRKMEVEIYMAMTVVMLAGVPTGLTTLNKVDLGYTPPATTMNPAPTTATGAAPNSTYGAAFASAPGVAQVPVWWYSVMALSSGLANGIKAGSSISLRDLRQYEQQARLATIQNPSVRQEVQRFYSECFVAARTKFLSDTPSVAATAAIASWGVEDPDWMGSHAYRDDRNLYASMYSDREVPGWAFDPSRDRDLAGAPVTPTWGRPTCKEWWEDTTIGVRAKLIAEAQATSTLWQTMTGFFAALPIENIRDKTARILLEKTPLSYTEAEPSKADFWRAPRVNDLWEIPRDLSAAMGVLQHFWTTYVAMAIIKPGLPMFQAIVLFGIYTFLGLILILSRYSLNTMVLGGLAIFTVKFWSVMWFITDWLDDQLILSMYPNTSSLMEFLGGIPSGDAIKRLILNLLIMSLYLGLPFIWSVMMAWVGIRVGQGLSQAKGNTIGNLSAAAAGGGLGRVLTRRIASRRASAGARGAAGGGGSSGRHR
jgi:hypothetical protein